jgi:hypothetical protein
MGKVAVIFLTVLLAIAVPPLLLEAGVPPEVALLVFPLAMALVLFLMARSATENPVAQVLLAVVPLEVPALLAVGAQGIPIIGGILDFLKFAVALVFIGFIFLVLCGIRTLGKPGAFIAAVGSLAIASALAFERALPLSAGATAQGDLPPRLAVLFLLASGILLVVLLAAGRER